MKKIILIACLFFVNIDTFSQSSFDTLLNEVSKDISDKLNRKNKMKVVVLYVTDISKVQTITGKYIADIISHNIVNDTGNFEVFDRENLLEISESKKLISEGYVDAAAAKELGKLLAVEAIIIGNYMVLSTTLKLTLKALDVNSGLVIASSMKDLPIDKDLAVVLGINISNSTNPNNGSRGFNSPLKSNEDYNNPATVNKECETNNTGDYCFKNSTQKSLSLSLYSKTPISKEVTYAPIINGEPMYSVGEITLEPNQIECFYNIKASDLIYYLREENTSSDWANNNYSNIKKGNILVEKCKSKTFEIK